MFMCTGANVPSRVRPVNHQKPIHASDPFTDEETIASLRFESSNRSRAGLITYFRQASPLAKPPYRITSRSTVRSHRPPRTTGQCRHAPTSPIRAPNAPTAGLDYISIHVVTTVSDGQTRFRGHPRSSSQG
jgi:hypothetical protein